MRKFRVLVFLFLLTLPTTAQPPPPPETVTRAAADDTALVADFYAPEADAPVLILLHMLNSRRGAYDPLIPDLYQAGYAILNVDMRGHGDSDGSQDSDAIIADMTAWVDWLADRERAGAAGLAFIGGSIGANVALISCARSDACRGAVALSPGLDYRGVKPEAALVDGLAERMALLVAAQADASSSTAIRQMFLNAKGDVSVRLYPGRAHGTRLFDSRYESVSRLILGWLEELFPKTAAKDSDECNPENYERGTRGYILCSSIPDAMKPIDEDHCLYSEMDDRDSDGVVCEVSRG